MTGDFFMKPYISIALIAVSSLWSLDVMAWTCTQKCPSSVFSGKLECKLYQELPKCERERQQRRDEEAKRREDQLSPEEKCQRDAQFATIQGQIVICDPSFQDIPNLENATVFQNDYPEVHATPSVNGQFVLDFPAEVLDAESEGVVEKQKAAAPEYKTKEITVKTEVGGPQPYFKPMPEGMDQGEVIAWNGKYKIKYKNGDRPIFTFPDYMIENYSIINIDKIIVTELKTGDWKLSLHYIDAPPSSKTLRKKPAPAQNINQQNLLEDSQIKL